MSFRYVPMAPRSKMSSPLRMALRGLQSQTTTKVLSRLAQREHCCKYNLELDHLYLESEIQPTEFPAAWRRMNSSPSMACASGRRLPQAPKSPTAYSGNPSLAIRFSSMDSQRPFSTLGQRKSMRSYPVQ